jgi:predicted metalloprotease with PDZ domain
MKRLSWIVVLLLWALPAGAQTSEPIRYTLRFLAPQTHYIDVEASFPAEGRPQIDLMMPVWTPGSYLVREYARHVEAVTASDPGRAPLTIEKTRKNRWRVTTGGAHTVWVRYRVYAHEMSVRTNWVDDEFALINGAPTFLTLLESRARPHEVRLLLPSGWSQSLSGMPAGAAAHTYVAPDYDTLVDSPIVAGNPAVYEFNAGGKPHYLVDFREHGAWKGPQAVQDLAKAVNQTARFWGDLPYDRYYFFNVIGAANNGLEHRNSTVMTTPRDSTDTREAYLRWLSLATHEYFHAWNVKRLRPIELGPFDYENEVYTRGLWFAEGVTDYYADLLLHRAGISTQAEYLGALSSAIRTLQTTPGRLVQSAELASYDAWIKYYRPDENSDNTSIDYYVKGAVIGFLLDARIRRMTAGGKSLDDLMRVMYRRFSGPKGFTPDDLRAAAADLVGTRNRDDMLTWLARTLETTEEVDYTDALAWLGLRLTPLAESPRAWLGVATRTDNQRTIVSEVRRGSPAFAAGISPSDEIVAINEVPVAAGQLAARVNQFAPSTRIVVTLSRRDIVRPLSITLGSDPGHGWLVSVVPVPTDAQARQLSAWLSQ